MKYDVVTLGETMIRLSPPYNERIEQADCLHIRVGGAESNVAVALARLGLRSAWVSRLVDNPLGRRIVNDIRAHGVDTSHVLWTNKGRVGTYYVEFGKTPRPITVIYDRANSAMTQLAPQDIDWDTLSDARLVHLTGITAALGDSCAELVERMIDSAREADACVSFDINYRSKLWSSEEAAEKLRPLCDKADILFVSSREAELLFGCDPREERLADALGGLFPAQAIAVTMGDAGAMCIHAGDSWSKRSYGAIEVDRVGSGDAFAAGFLFAYLEGEDWPICLDYGNALGSIKCSIPGDLAITTRDELRSLVEQRSSLDIDR